jgi:hypothetical protein
MGDLCAAVGPAAASSPRRLSNSSPAKHAAATAAGNAACETNCTLFLCWTCGDPWTGGAPENGCDCLLLSFLESSKPWPGLSGG